jgi:hypothetical protein
MRKTASVLGALAALAGTSWALAASAPGSPLLSGDQEKVESLALALRNEPAVKAARDAAIRRFQAAAPAALPDGKAQLEGAVDEAVYGALLVAANDPAHPRVVWSEAPPHRDGKDQVPGSRYGGDNPDRIYRSIAVDPASHYEIHGQRSATPSIDFSFEAIPAPSLWGKAKAVIQAKDIDVAADGSFVITADADPANGRRNHLQLPPGTANILLRDTLDDWNRELPNTVTVRRLDAAAPAARTHDALVQQAAQQIAQSIDESLKFLNGFVWSHPANELDPFVRGLQDGVQGAVVAVNRYSFKDDEAVVITLDPISARYIGFQVTDPWLRSVPYRNRSGSLSSAQARPNADGSFTYVLSAKDPGVWNWLDTGGLHDGALVVRWELLSQPPQVGKAVREERVVKLSELAAALPAGAAGVDSSARKSWLDARAAGYARRL